MIDLISSLWQPGHFFVGNGLRCAWQFEAEQTLPWELFRGRLLEPRHTRLSQTFLTWNLLRVENGAVADEPLLSLLLDEPAGVIHMTRGLLCRVWTSIDAAGGIESEQREAWVRELVGTLFLQDAKTPDDIADELGSLIGQAIVGTSRLPLTSLEAPLPQFTFGQLAYVGQTFLSAGGEAAPRRAPDESTDLRLPLRSWQSLFATKRGSPPAKLLEFTLRTASPQNVPALAESAATYFGDTLPAVFRRMFNDISLSPFTDFVDKALLLLATLPPADEIDTLALLIRQIARHLTAYDLVLFHYRGANYPDALLLDALLRRLLIVAAKHPDLFRADSPQARMRRRALRVGCLLRHHYEGHSVPDQPTSPGENARVFPAPHVPVPEEQILEPNRRERRLFEGEPLASLLTPITRDLLSASCRDLADPAEVREGGTALFIDRPLGFFKAPAEIDQTPLLSYEAYSRRLATRRLLDAQKLAELLGLDVPTGHWPACGDLLTNLPVLGLSINRVPESPRPAVSLADARKVADDFVIVRSMPRSLIEFWDAMGREPQPWPLVARIVNAAGEPVMAAFDESGAIRGEFDGDWSQGSVVRRGIERPRAGLRWH